MSSFQQILDLVNQCQFDAENQQTAYKKKIKHQKKMIAALKKHAQQCENMCKSLKLENKHLWKMIEKQDRTHSAPEVIDLMNDDATRPIKEEKVTVVIENDHDEVATSIVEVEEEESVEVEDDEIEVDDTVEVEETEEEVEVVEVEVEEEEETVEVEESKEEPADEDEEEVFMITIDGTDYFTTSETDGMIYAVTKDGDVGEEVGYFEEGEPGFYEE
jgi:hypothetical protein